MDDFHCQYRLSTSVVNKRDALNRVKRRDVFMRRRRALRLQEGRCVTPEFRSTPSVQFKFNLEWRFLIKFGLDKS